MLCFQFVPTPLRQEKGVREGIACLPLFTSWHQAAGKLYEGVFALKEIFLAQ